MALGTEVRLNAFHRYKESYTALPYRLAQTIHTFIDLTFLWDKEAAQLGLTQPLDKRQTNDDFVEGRLIFLTLYIPSLLLACPLLRHGGLRHQSFPITHLLNGLARDAS